MAILFHAQDIKFPKINKSIIKSWIIKVIHNENCTYKALNIIFCTDKFLLSLNNKYLLSDNYTDVIAFDYSKDNDISGDIYISIERVKENAPVYSNSYTEELNRVIIHGVLHLIGYKDKTETEKKIMTDKEDKYLAFLE